MKVCVAGASGAVGKRLVPQLLAQNHEVTAMTRTPEKTTWHEHGALEPFTSTKRILLTTYRRDNTPVATPVSIAFDGDHAFFRTWSSSGKAKRLRRSSTVEIAPSTLGGMQAGPAVRARARLLTGSEATQAKRALGRQHPVLQRLLVPLAHRLMRHHTLHYELTPEID
jgi:PPOX class probable F420-dependent enzyme